MEKRYLQLDDLSSYKKSFELSNYVWNLVSAWAYFPKDTIGKQYVNAIDSVSANIAEGFGRFHKKDKIKFYYYSLGSLKECISWNEKAKARRLINEEEYKMIANRLEELPKEIHQLIRFTNERLKV